jgi:hypothetical protein
MPSSDKYLKVSRIITIITIGLTSVLSSCSNPDSASKENFTKVISDYIKDKRICDVSGYDLPVTIFDKEITDGSRKTYAESLNFFSSTGLIKATKGNVSRPSPIIWVVNPPEPATTYSLTEEGAKNSVSILPSESSRMLGNKTISYAFCYAKGRELISIDSFKNTVKNENVESVKVSYIYKPIGLADWNTKGPGRELYNKPNGFDTVKQGKGWVVNDSVK